MGDQAIQCNTTAGDQEHQAGQLGRIGSVGLQLEADIDPSGTDQDHHDTEDNVHGFYTLKLRTFLNSFAHVLSKIPTAQIEQANQSAERSQSINAPAHQSLEIVHGNTFQRTGSRCGTAAIGGSRTAITGRCRTSIAGCCRAAIAGCCRTIIVGSSRTIISGCCRTIVVRRSIARCLSLLRSADRSAAVHAECRIICDGVAAFGTNHCLFLLL